MYPGVELSQPNALNYPPQRRPACGTHAQAGADFAGCGCSVTGRSQRTAGGDRRSDQALLRYWATWRLALSKLPDRKLSGKEQAATISSTTSQRLEKLCRR
jgi:hypothetical protein